MKRRAGAAVWGLMLTMSFAAAACRGAESAKMAELQRVKAGETDVVLLSAHDGLRHGKDAFVIEFKASNGNFVDVGVVRASANMPMPGMPMFGSIDVTRTDVPGRYAADSQFDMAGTWRMTVEWDGPAGRGSVSFPGIVQ